MKRLKTFGKYVLLIIGFYILSHILIFIGLNTTYSSIKLKGNMPQEISISSAKATSVNGKIKGKILREFDSQYIKFNFYTDIDTLAGSYYIMPSELTDNNFEFYFKSNHIKYYSVEMTNEKNELNSSNNFSIEKYKSHFLFPSFLTLLFI